MNKHTVTFDGATFTRGSENRTYTHAIIVTTLITDMQARAEREGRAQWKMDVKYFTELANGTSEFLARNGNKFTGGKSDESRMQEAADWLAGGVEGRIACHLEHANKQVAALPKTADGLSVITCSGWCGRYDLAQKAAGSVKQGTAHIVASEVTTKAKK